MHISTCHPDRKHAGRGLCSTCYYQWYRKHGNPKILKAKRRENTKYARKKRKKYPELDFAGHLKSKYNLTSVQYQELFDAQAGVCAICGNPETQIIKGKLIRLAVDHDHETGKIRGLLCSSCNNGLGRFKHNLERLQSAIKYLKTEE